MMYREHLTIETRGRGTHEITSQVQHVVERSGVDQGLCFLFIQHTSASLIVCENADPTVRHDLERFAADLVPDGDPSFRHDSEGPDDMPAHIRSILTLTSLTHQRHRDR
jgi:secondary thiamine-phosphate synthase enzyme